MSIQSFYPVISINQTIKLHPLVCAAFNADFDGDQMGIHLPISLKGQIETRITMITLNNCLSPATGELIINLSQDMILGCYYLYDIEFL